MRCLVLQVKVQISRKNKDGLGWTWSWRATRGGKSGVGRRRRHPFVFTSRFWLLAIVLGDQWVKTLMVGCDVSKVSLAAPTAPPPLLRCKCRLPWFFCQMEIFPQVNGFEISQTFLEMFFVLLIRFIYWHTKSFEKQSWASCALVS